MNRKDLIKQVAEETGTTVIQAKKIIDKTFNTIIDSIKSGDKVSIVGFGVFDRIISVPRLTHHPIKKEKVKVPSRPIPKFYPSKIFKLIVKG